jgi:hypothetical protein
MLFGDDEQLVVVPDHVQRVDLCCFVVQDQRLLRIDFQFLP